LEIVKVGTKDFSDCSYIRKMSFYPEHNPRILFFGQYKFKGIRAMALENMTEFKIESIDEQIFGISVKGNTLYGSSFIKSGSVVRLQP